MNVGNTPTKLVAVVVSLFVASFLMATLGTSVAVGQEPASEGAEAQGADGQQDQGQTTDDTDQQDEPDDEDVPGLDPETAALFEDPPPDEDEQDEVELFDEELLDRLAFAGSAQVDYLYVPTNKQARELSLDGFTTELSLKLAADVTDSVSVEVKTCFGCHGFELGAAQIDIRPVPALRIRAGKFVPQFGDFPIRHDPANHLTSDKPLPYDMGRMLRLREWNMSVLPAPYVDNGLEVNLHHSIGEHVEMDYNAFVLGGLRGSNQAVDVDFIQSRSPDLYYVDNNSEPAVGGRLSTLFFFSRNAVLTLGGSAMWGRYDPDRDLEYLILGGDLVLRLWHFTLRMEYLLRRTEMGLGANPEERFQYGPGEDGEFDAFQLKDGFYVEVDFPFVEDMFEAVLRFDGLRRQGNVLVGSPLRSESAILRYTAGINYLFAAETFRVKLSGEFYDFSDFDDEVAVHLGLVGAF